uniref:CHCH domain-containing protein n=1 Tax=Toxoplasma gondii COUG TaxID=1074873 RepID=A0A2G8XU51_TOXGO|nr:hypothetical protein TGCOUG_208300 [Toxoplasma gondii COUG]
MASENDTRSRPAFDPRGKEVAVTAHVAVKQNTTKSELDKSAPTSRAQMSKYWGDDVDDKVERTGCSEPYGRLVDCLDVQDKDWRKCREELQEFRRCCHEKKVPGA